MTVNVPPRPDEYPTQWVMTFAYFDKLTAGGGISRPTPCETKQEAQKAAGFAPAHNDGAGIRVTAAYAYPPVGSNEEPTRCTF